MDILARIEEKENENQEIRDRQDADAAVFAGGEYELKGVNGKKITSAYHIALPEAGQFLDKAVSKLTSVENQVQVISERISKEQIQTIENFLRDMQYEVDNYLIAKGELDSLSQYCEYVCARGPIVEMNMLRVVDGIFIADSRPLDSRWFTCDIVDGKMDWGCIEMTRNISDIKKQYNITKELSGTTKQVKHYFDSEIQAVFLDGEQVLEEANPYKEPPFVIAYPSTSSSIKDDDYLKYYGDSILHGLRLSNGDTLFSERNYLASMYKTQASMELFPTLAFPSADGTYQELPEEYPAGTGKMLATKAPPIEIPHGKVSEAMDRYDKIVSEVMYRKTFGSLDYGVINLPLSYLAINRVLQGRDDLLLPRLNCIAWLKQASDLMKIRQVNTLAQTIEIGEEGHKRKYLYTDLQGEYTIWYKFYTMTQEGLAAASSLASQLKGHVSEEYIQDNILNLKDPEAERSKLKRQNASEADPVIELLDQAIDFIRAQEKTDDKETKIINDTQARLIKQRIISILHQRSASEHEPQKVNLEQSFQTKEPGISGMPMFSNSEVSTK